MLVLLLPRDVACTTPIRTAFAAHRFRKSSLWTSSRITGYHSNHLATKRFASVAETTEQGDAAELLDPSQLFNGTIPYPKSLSPSSAMEFRNCPQSFLFQYLYGIKQPTSPVLAKGTMCHEALEQIFDLDPPDRTLEHLQNLLRSSWAKHRTTEKYNFLFGTDSLGQDWDREAEQKWGREGLQLLENYYNVEDPKLVERPNPIQREIWLRADLTVDPKLGVTGHAVNGAKPNGDNESHDERFLVRGIVDRLDMVRVSKNEVALRIVDYKTGKAPNLKYSQAMNAKIVDEAFYQLKIYALLLREKGAGRSSQGLDLRVLRLLHLTSASGKGKYLDMDLGETQEERDIVLQEIHADLSNVWTSICELVATQDPKAFVGCSRPFCYCHKCRETFVPDTVWEPPAAI